jgi:hypothetical protein
LSETEPQHGGEGWHPVIELLCFAFDRPSLEDKLKGPLLLAAAVGSFLACQSALAEDFLSAPVQPGVYMCRDQGFNPNPKLIFGLINDVLYSSFDGVVGTYAYDRSTGILEIGLQTGAPARYVRIFENAFRGLNEDGSLNQFVCPLNPEQDPTSPPW